MTVSFLSSLQPLDCLIFTKVIKSSDKSVEEQLTALLDCLIFTKVNKCSDKSMEEQVPALLGNSDRPTDRPTNEHEGS